MKTKKETFGTTQNFSAVLDMEYLTIQKIIYEIRIAQLKAEYHHKDYVYGVDDVLVLLHSMNKKTCIKNQEVV